MATILVTGGAGFLGSHIADELSDRGHNVRIFDRTESPYIRQDQQMLLGDVTNPEDIENAVEGCDYIYHMAALADLNAAKTRPVTTVETNVLGTVRFLEAARHAGVKRIMFASTVYVYSREGGFYKCSKQACENYIEEFHHRYGLEYTILRYGSLYGPRADSSNGVYRLIRQAMEEGVIHHSGGPDDRREYIHVKDAARLSADAIGDEFANHHLVITGNQAMRIQDLFTMFSEILGHKVEPEFSENDDDDFDPSRKNGHYKMTPYTFTPKVGHKLTTNYFVDMGQGLLQVVEQIYDEKKTEKTYSDS